MLTNRSNKPIIWNLFIALKRSIMNRPKVANMKSNTINVTNSDEIKIY